jgi:acetyl-CoA acetyltransferase
MNDIKFVAQSPYGGGGACSPVQFAALAIAGGVAETVVCYRAFNERSGVRFGTGMQPPAPEAATASDLQVAWNTSYGLATAAAFTAMFARRYMYEYGATSEDFGQVAVIDRQNAATNPKAWFYKRPITIEDHQKSPMIADPLRLLDCCQESDGGVALVITSTERARDMPHRPGVIHAAAQGFTAGQAQMSSYFREKISGLPEMAMVGRQLWEQSGIGPDDVQAAILYDHFTPYVLFQLEALGFCKRGEAKDFIAEGHLAMGGKLPLNPHGGLLGEAYIHGLNNIAEAVRQIRGTAVNQIANVERLVVTGGTGVPTSALILGTPA